jgi:hypothetical protein
MPASLNATFGIVALIRSLAIACRRLLEERPHLRRGDMRRHWIAVENKWLATRYGLNAMYIRTPGGKRRVLSHDLSEVIERVMPIARETGDDLFLKTLLPVRDFESGADRQRRLYREHGHWKVLIDEMAQSFSKELQIGGDTRSPTLHTSHPSALTSGAQIDEHKKKLGVEPQKRLTFGLSDSRTTRSCHYSVHCRQTGEFDHD